MVVTLKLLRFMDIWRAFVKNLPVFKVVQIFAINDSFKGVKGFVRAYGFNIAVKGGFEVT